jgi:hypothetical protein
LEQSRRREGPQQALSRRRAEYAKARQTGSRAEKCGIERGSRQKLIVQCDPPCLKVLRRRCSGEGAGRKMPPLLKRMLHNFETSEMLDQNTNIRFL